MKMSTELAFSREVEGATCQGLMRQEHWHNGELSVPCNVLHLQVAPDKWLRFFFDAGVFFWRTESQPGDAQHHDHHLYKSVHVSEAERLVGQVVASAVFTGNSGASERELVMNFSGRSRLKLINAADQNTVLVE